MPICTNRLFLIQQKNEEWCLPEVSVIEEERIGARLPDQLLIMRKRTGLLETMFKTHQVYLSINCNPDFSPKHRQMRYFQYAKDICEHGFRLCLQSRIAIDELYLNDYLKLEE